MFMIVCLLSKKVLKLRESGNAVGTFALLKPLSHNSYKFSTSDSDLIGLFSFPFFDRFWRVDGRLPPTS